MKRTINKLILLAFALTAAISLNSCLGDDNNDNFDAIYHEITPQDKSKVINEMAGQYAGKVSYFKATLSSETDSLDASWTIQNDSTIDITMPVSFLSNYILDNDNKASIAAMADPYFISGTINFPTYLANDYYEAGYYQMGIKQSQDVLSFVTTDNKVCTLNFETVQGYSINGYSYYQSITYHKPQTVICLLLNNLQVGDKTYSIQLPIMFSGKKQ